MRLSRMAVERLVWKAALRVPVDRERRGRCHAGESMAAGEESPEESGKAIAGGGMVATMLGVVR
jgi:hypothetical protein